MPDHTHLILGGITNQTFTVGSEGDVRGRDTVALVVGDDLHAAALVDADTENRIRKMAWLAKANKVVCKMFSDKNKALIYDYLYLFLLRHHEAFKQTATSC